MVDVDIKGFFDEVNHVKLIRQLWTLGIRDKQFLVIIRKASANAKWKSNVPTERNPTRRYSQPSISKY